jgi:superoxide reductase
MTENNFEEAQTYQDPYNPSELEQRHVPVIETDTNYVKAAIGEEKHVMEINHWIQYIELFADGKSVARIDLSPGDEPEAEFDVDVPNTKKIVAQELCNIHGLWENELEINK